MISVHRISHALVLHRKSPFHSRINFRNEHSRLAQHWAMTRITPFHMRASFLRKSLLRQKRCSLIFFADQICRGDILIRCSGQCCCLDLARLRNELRCPERAVEGSEVIEKRLFGILDVEAAIFLEE